MSVMAIFSLSYEAKGSPVTHQYSKSAVRCLKVTPIAHIVYLKAPPFFCSLSSVWDPLIPAIKPLRPNVAYEYPENRITKSQIEKPSTRCRHKCDANATPPVVGINVQAAEFSVI